MANKPSEKFTLAVNLKDIERCHGCPMKKYCTHCSGVPAFLRGVNCKLKRAAPDFGEIIDRLHKQAKELGASQCEITLAHKNGTAFSVIVYTKEGYAEKLREENDSTEDSGEDDDDDN